MLLLSSKTVSAAKKMMSLVSGRAGTDAAASSSSLSLRAKKNKRKLYRPEISSPIDMPAHPVSLTAFSANMSVSAQTYFLFTQSSEERLFSLTSADPGLFPASEWALYSFEYSEYCWLQKLFCTLWNTSTDVMEMQTLSFNSEGATLTV